MTNPPPETRRQHGRDEAVDEPLPPDGVVMADSTEEVALAGSQLALQAAAVICVLSLAWPYFGWIAQPLPWRETSFAIGGVAFVFATLARQPWPWRILHAAFMPLAWFFYPIPG